MQKKLVCLLHVPKTAGSSAWLTLAESAFYSDPMRYSVVDAHYNAMNSHGRRSFDELAPYACWEFDGFLQSFRKQPHEIMFVHLHTAELPRLPTDIDIDFLVICRNPRIRLASALRTWLGGSEDSAEKNRLHEISKILSRNPFLVGLQKLGPISVRNDVAWMARFPFSFFFDGVSRGVDFYLERCFGEHWMTRRNLGLPPNVRVIPFSFEEVIINSGRFASFVESEYQVVLRPICHLEKTRTVGRQFNEGSESIILRSPSFAALFDQKVESEELAIKRLFELGFSSE